MATLSESDAINIVEDATTTLVSAADDEQMTEGQGSSDVIEYHFPGAKELSEFSDWYRQYHGYLAVVVCTFGIVANVLNIVVLTRRSMRTATNCILTGLAVSDGLTMAAYLPFALYFYVFNTQRTTFTAACFMLVYATFSVIVHTVSIWLTVALAVFRYICIKHHRHGAKWCTVGRAKLAICLVNVATVVVCIPNLISIRVVRLADDDGSLPVPPRPSIAVDSNVTSVANGSRQRMPVTTTTDKVSSSTLADEADDGADDMWSVDFKRGSELEIFIRSLNFWIQAFLVKLVPCFGLTILSLLLVQSMKAAEDRRRRLLSRTTSVAMAVARTVSPRNATVSTSLSFRTPAGGNTTRTRSSMEDRTPATRRTSRTTRMLLAVVVLFIVTEFPQGIINLLSGLLTNFDNEIYNSLGDLLDILVLINNGVNFILYCSMSKQFRDTFVSVLCPNKTICFVLTSRLHSSTAPVAASAVVDVDAAAAVELSRCFDADNLLLSVPDNTLNARCRRSGDLTPMGTDVPPLQCVMPSVHPDFQAAVATVAAASVATAVTNDSDRLFITVKLPDSVD